MTEQCKHHGDIAGGLDRIYTELKELSDRQGKTERGIATFQAELKSCREDVTRHEIYLQGSNGDGLRTRVALAEDRLKKIGDPKKQAKRAQQTSIGSIIVAIGAAIGAGVAAILGWK